jgi:hypothetical protein
MSREIRTRANMGELVEEAMAGGGRGSRRGRHGDNRCRRGVLEVLGELVAEEGRRHIVGGGGD